jgi:hypothetical protein
MRHAPLVSHRANGTELTLLEALRQCDVEPVPLARPPAVDLATLLASPEREELGTGAIGLVCTGGS